MFSLGALISAFILTKSHFLPKNLPHIDIVNTICIMSGTCLISACLFLSLHGLFTVTSRRWAYSLFAFSSASLLFLMLFFYYYSYLYIVRAINKIEDHPNLFPVLAEKMTDDKTRGDAEKWATLAYRIYGVRVAYSNAANAQTYFVPSQNDTKFRSDMEKMDSAVGNLRHVSLGLLYGATDIVLAMFVTFLLGLCWATFRPLETTPISSTEIDSQKT